MKEKRKSPTSVRLHPAIEEALLNKCKNSNTSINNFLNELLKKEFTKK